MGSLPFFGALSWPGLNLVKLAYRPSWLDGRLC